MSYSDPVEVIDHIPADFDLQPQPRRPLATRFFLFLGALTLVVGALIKGAWK